MALRVRKTEVKALTNETEYKALGLVKQERGWTAEPAQV